MSKIPMEAVFYYTPAPSDKETALRALCARLGIRFKVIAPDQAGQKLGALVGLPGFAAEEVPAASLADEVLILHRFADRKIDVFLAAMRKADIPRIALKAVVTEHNADWSLTALAAELQREHDEFAKQYAAPQA